MPADLLVPAFALTLALNAALILMAIRALRSERRPEASERSAPPPNPDPKPVRAAAAKPEVLGPDDAAPAGAVSTDAPDLVSPRAPAPVGADENRADRPPEPPVELVVEPVVEPAPSVVAPPAATASKVGPKGTGRRRKFSLPPLEDPDKVSRSIETFLTGADAGAAVPAGATIPAPVVTVAAIQLLGGTNRGVLERTVRSTARGTDSVSVDRRGRVRVVLAGTGELAAHAYLRRIRAIVEPVLEADDPTSRVVIATATELDGATATARRRADRRLAIALRAAAADTGRPLDASDVVDDVDALDQPEPKVAGH